MTGGGGGIGAAIAEELGRGGWFVVTVDPLVTLDGTEQLPEPEETTAGRIVAAGGSAQASSASVTDGAALRELFEELVDEHGGLDAVVNVAGITRQSYFAQGHRGGLRRPALGPPRGLPQRARCRPAAHGRGRARAHPRRHLRLGMAGGRRRRVQRAKRAVAALTWQLGRHAPPGVTVNAISPIASTRMVAAALERARQAGRAGGGGGLTLDSMPGPEDLAPLGAYLVGDEFGWCSGQVLFAGGPEVAVVDQPRLIEVVRSDGRGVPRGGARGRHPARLRRGRGRPGDRGRQQPPVRAHLRRAGRPPSRPSADVRSCAIVSDRPRAGRRRHRRARGPLDHLPPRRASRMASTAPPHALQRRRRGRRTDRCRRRSPSPVRDVAGTSTDGWQRMLADHQGITERLHADAAWARAAADYAAGADRPVRLVTLTDAPSPAGRSRAQAAAQLARVAAGGTGGRVTAFAVSVEAPATARAAPGRRAGRAPPGQPEAAALAGAELAVGDGWIGLRSHPRPIGTITYGGPAVPAWLDATLREIVGAPTARVEQRRPHDDPAHPRDRRARAPLGPGPHRLVSRTSGTSPDSGPGDPSRMHRRFDVDTYRAESAGWHVEKFVNVAAATGRNSVDETLELDRQRRGERRSRRHHRRSAAGRHRGRVDRDPRPADGGPASAGSARWAASGIRCPSPRCCARCRSGTWCSS